MKTANFTITSVEDFVANIKKGTFGVTMITKTEPKMNKRNNPFFGRVQKITYLSNVGLGLSYQNTINNRLERLELENNYQAEKPKGKHFINDFILASDKDETIHYLRTTMYKNTKSETIYLLDGQIVDGDILKEIKVFIPKATTCQKQQNAGLEEQDQVIVRDFKVENIIHLAQGEKVYTPTEIYAFAL